MASYLFRAFAARGIVVAAVEHTDGTASYTTLDGGAPLPFAPRMLPRTESLKRRASELLAAAQPGALGLPGGLSTGDVFLGGHSYGGVGRVCGGGEFYIFSNFIYLVILYI